MDLFFYSNVAYNWDSKLSRTSLVLERRLDRDDDFPITDMTFRTLQYYAGFGAKYESKTNFNFNLGIGIGAYHTLNDNYKELKLYRPQSGAILQLSAGIYYKFPI